jgi:Tol biopolymer transport system component
MKTGDSLGAYRILGKLGEGGMGEVYRAHDPRLGRDVAIKVLPPALAGDPDALARFEREARAVGALNHPNIVNVFDTGRDRDVTYVVMELLEGETLRSRLQGTSGSFGSGTKTAASGSGVRGRGLPRKKALEIAHLVALGLAAAHARGIVHRDLKPENILLTTDGRVKVLDFGLARAMPAIVQHAGETRTQLSPVGDSAPGTVLGTAGYMAPEQVRGEPVDHRADIFAFGAVLYEMLTGERAFDGGSPIETLSAILKIDPLESPAAAVAIQGPLEPLVRHCLEKAADERFQSARDLAFQLHAIATGTLSTASAERAMGAASRLRWLLPAGIGVGALLAGLAIGYRLQPQVAEQIVTASIPMPPGVHMHTGISPARSGGIAVSRDGRHVAFVVVAEDGRSRIFVRSLGDQAARELPNSEGGTYPVWSPDGTQLLFRQGPNFVRTSIDGGPPQVVRPAGNLRSAPAWSDQGVLLFHETYRGPLLRVPVAGGEPTIVHQGGNVNWFSPVWLPDGRRFLAARFAYDDVDAKEAGIYLGSIDSQALTVIVPGRIAEVTLGDGELFFRRGVELVAQRFDAASATLLGEPRVLSTHASIVAAGGGTLVYYDPPKGLSEGHQITWFSRGGEVLSRLGPSGTYRDPRLSPDGRTLAIARADDNGIFSLWTFDLARNIDTRVSGATVVSPAWSHDGRALYGGFAGTISRFDPASGVPPVKVHASPGYINAGEASPDGKELLFHETVGGSLELRAIPLGGPGAARVVRSALRPGQQGETALSPDGRWLVGQVPDGGRRLFAIGYPQGRRIPVAGVDGFHPRWHRDGRELYFATPFENTERIMAVTVSWTADGPEFSQPRELFRIANAVFVNRGFDVNPDGDRFVAVVRSEPDRTPLTLQVRMSSR